MDIVAYLQQGDKFVFEQTFFDWHEKVYAYFLLKTKNTSTSEELTQLTFIKLWNYRHTLKLEHSLEIQLFRIARTTLIDDLRLRARQRKMKQELMQTANMEFYNPATEVESHRQIAFALNALPPVRKKVFILKHKHGFSYKEIADRLSISNRTVEKHISLAIKQLKKILSILILLLVQL